MEKGGLYSRGSILLSKSNRTVDKNHSRAVTQFNLSIIDTGLRIRPGYFQIETTKDASN